MSFRTLLLNLLASTGQMGGVGLFHELDGAPCVRIGL